MSLPVKNLIFIVFILNSKICFSQSNFKQLFENKGFTVDYQTQSYKGLSFGYGFIKPFEHASMGKGLMIKNELIFKKDQNPLIYSPQITYFLFPGIVYGGLKLGYYTDFSHGFFSITPEVGLGLPFIFLVYGRNLNFSESGFMKIPENNLSIKLIIPLTSK